LCLPDQLHFVNTVLTARLRINRNWRNTGRVDIRVPRASGDKPSLLPVVSLIDSCSPRQRG
ncbi:hypothetical protein, partial [Escherichia coli]|uniref:hypothetical protein n=1 Tax=Escherichia coli TaxID=562 RepID=UPI001BB47B6F